MRKYVKNVNVKSCFNVIVVCLLAALPALVPFIFGSGVLVFYYETLPYVGDASIVEATVIPFGAVLSLLPINNPNLASVIMQVVAYICSYHSLVYFGILALNLVLALILVITRWSFIRVIARILSIIMGIAMILLTIVNLIYVIGYVLLAINGIGIQFLLNSFGVLPIFFCLDFCIILTVKQFRWFKKLY